MSKRAVHLSLYCLAMPLLVYGQATGQPPTSQKSPSKPTAVAQTQAPAANGQTGAADAKPVQSPEQLIEQGKALFKTIKYPQALAKFEAVLKLNAEHDEALGLAAETAYRADNQLKARNYFMRRAELANQRDTIKAYSFYRAALTIWREAHDEVAKYGVYKAGVTSYVIPEKAAIQTGEQLTQGLYLAERALSLLPNLAEAHNVKNLLLMEAALLKSESAANAQFKLAKQALTRSQDLLKERATKATSADFGLPTIRLGEYASVKTTDQVQPLADEFQFAGGTVLKQIAPVFPTAVPKNSESDNQERAGSRGALTAAFLPGKVKVEVLIDKAGDVVFAHVVQGRSDLNGPAVAAARKWKFSPAKFNDQAVQLSAMITFDMRPGRGGGSAPPAPKPPQ